MKHNREYEIAWQGLKPGVHHYEYHIQNRFFEERGSDVEFNNLKAKINLHFDKKTNFFLLHFDIDGVTDVICDRCGDEFSLRLWDEFDLLVKLAAEDVTERFEDADAVFIPRHETVIDISDWIYEYILLSIPLQKIHPNRPDGTPGCNEQALDLLNQLSEKENKKNELWKGLDALKEQHKKDN